VLLQWEKSRIVVTPASRASSAPAKLPTYTSSAEYRGDNVERTPRK
jgi:hypothetical protein